MSIPKFCPKCGKETDGAKLCPGCGHVLDGQEEPKKKSKKKLIAIIVGAVIVLSIIGAAMGGGEDEVAKTETTDPAPTEQATDVATDPEEPAAPANFLEEKEIQAEDMGNGHKYEYILVSNEEMDGITGEILTQFANDILVNQKCNWFSIIAADGRLIYFFLDVDGAGGPGDASVGPERTTAPYRGLPDTTYGWWKKNADGIYEYSDAQ